MVLAIGEMHCSSSSSKGGSDALLGFLTALTDRRIFPCSALINDLGHTVTVILPRSGPVSIKPPERNLGVETHDTFEIWRKQSSNGMDKALFILEAELTVKLLVNDSHCFRLIHFLDLWRTRIAI